MITLRRLEDAVQEQGRMAGKRVAIVLSGGNIHGSLYTEILSGERADVAA